VAAAVEGDFTAIPLKQGMVASAVCCSTGAAQRRNLNWQKFYSQDERIFLVDVEI